MKKFIKISLLLFLWAICIPVFAAPHSVHELVPVGESATVDTDMFTYNEISFVPTVPGKDFGKINIASVLNKSGKLTPISIDILLFDSNRANIGFVAYCTEEDISGDYAQKKLGKGATSPLSFNVTSRYLIDEKTPKDVAYYAVLDDNPYCHVGGKNKYEGLTIEEIISGKITTKDEEGQSSTTIDFDTSSLFAGTALIALLIGGVFAIGLFVVQGLILNALHKRMYASTTALAYLPIACNYISMKLAFGEQVAKIYIIAYFVSFASILLGPLVIISYVLSFASFVSFVVVIVKLVTKKYDMFSAPMEGKDNNVDNVTVVFGEKNEDDNRLNDSKGQEVIDLSYSGGDQTIGPEPSSFNYNMMDFVNSDDSSMDDSESSNNNMNQNSGESKNDQEGQSDLMDLFR